jgi:hypothetical protein
VSDWAPNPIGAVFNNAGVAVASRVLDTVSEDDAWLWGINCHGVWSMAPGRSRSSSDRTRAWSLIRRACPDSLVCRPKVPNSRYSGSPTRCARNFAALGCRPSTCTPVVSKRALADLS